MKTTAYARISTDSDDQLNSLQNQLSFFEQYFIDNNLEKADCGILCSKEGNVHLEGFYGDEGISGTSLKKREAFKQMIRDAKAGKFNLIVTKSVSRFGRSVEDTAKTIKDLKEYGVGVYFLDLQINSLDNSKEFMINLFASLAQEESNNKSYIVKFGVKKAQKIGKFISQAPYGYDKINGMLQVNETEAEVVREIFNLYYHDGHGGKKIADYLNYKGIPTKKGSKWSQPIITRLLDNSIYIGKQIQNTVTSVDINRGLVKELPREEWIIHDFDHLKIIDEHLFESVQREKLRRSSTSGRFTVRDQKTLDEFGEEQIIKIRTLNRGKTRQSTTHLFSNIFFCGNCGSTMRRKKRLSKDRKRVTGYRWLCSSNDRGKDQCRFANMYMEERLIEEIGNLIKGYKDAKEEHKNNFDNYLKIYLDSNNSDEELTEIDKNINTLEKRREKNFDLYSDDEISKDEYVQRNNKIESELSALKERKLKLSQIDKEVIFAKMKFDEYIKALEKFDLDKHFTNTGLRKIINKIEAITSNDMSFIKIDWKFIDKTTEEIYLSSIIG